ncbi:hypothetical protein DFR86_05635 [Acidianus sulfidivorans JP7]|uniref:Uncharacterized protein n=1 Tax=Acidianus sulfidivorans JP7 TaxID=619593 RepID=A0A2U9IM77_9CREN|nr:hypothetical protein [Acidianus sulfidivorans]AWR97095.1 hypothetical protein DFR86_05635 [Acidianus sulfidivorans JP7]
MSVEDGLKPSVILISPSDIEENVKKLEEEIKNHEQIDIESQKKIQEEIDNIWKSLAWLKIAESQGMWKSKTCRHSNQGSCEAWNISDPSRLGIPEDAITTAQDGSKRVVIAKFYQLCISCPLYEARRNQ